MAESNNLKKNKKKRKISGEFHVEKEVKIDDFKNLGKNERDDYFYSEKRKKVSLDIESEVESKDTELLKKVSYFEKIMKNLKYDMPKDKDIFVQNTLEESRGSEVELCCHPISSHCIELLLSHCKETDIWMSFIAAFSKEKETITINPNASHVTELLIKYSLQSIQNWSTVLDSNEDSEKKEQINFYISWISEMGDFLIENFIDFLKNDHACHVACSIIRALGGDLTNSTEFISKKAQNHKKEFASKIVSENETSLINKVYLEEIPKKFKVSLKQMSRGVRQMKNISKFATRGSCATVFESLVISLMKRLPKQCKRFITDFSKELFSKTVDGVPHALLHKSCSFIIEKLFQVANQELQQHLWTQYFTDNIEILVVHQIGNYTIQRLFDAVKDKSLLEDMCDKVSNLFNKILEARHYGIFLSIASACNRLKAHQALFMKSIVQCLDCIEPVERQLKLVPLLLSFRKYQEHNSQIQVCLQGSLLLQNLLLFQKPIKLVKSLISMKPEELSYLACHVQGCHVLTSFFKSATVGDKNKDKLIQCFQPVMLNMACDYNGNLTLSRIWLTLSLKQKGVVAGVLSNNEEALKSNKNGNIIYNKFKIFFYKRKSKEWKEFQLTLVQKS